MSHLPFISNLLLVNFKTNTSQNETVSKVLWHLHEKMRLNGRARALQILL